MKKVFSIILVLILISAKSHFAQNGVLSSQIGYDTGYPVRVMIRSDQRDHLSDDAIFEVVDMKNETILNGPVEKWGKKWESYWWTADLSQLKYEGRYIVKIMNKDNVFLISDTIELGENLLWSRCFKTIAFDFLQSRAEQARTGKGWRDCGSDLQEFSSHMVAVDGLCDILKTNDNLLTQYDKEHIVGQILTGSEYLAHLQDKADSLGFGIGPVVHEDRQKDVVTGNVAKASMIFAKVAQILHQEDPQKSKEYIARAKNAFTWIERNGPIVNPEEQIFFPSVHGAPLGAVPPADQWMTRDLVMMIYAAVEIFKTGDHEYMDKAVKLARQLEKRQVPQDEDEGGFYGHFYTYDDYAEYGNIKFTEKANIHCGAWSREGRIYNKGGHYPHYLMPLIEMINLWPSHKDSDLWRKTLHDFAYGYFLPVVEESPFLILPSGYYHNEGLLYFSSWYHAHNNIYAFAASLALEFQKYFQDDRFLEIAIGNIQWIAGLNCGWRQEGSQQYKSFSMISGIGSRNLESWTKIPGTIINGFSASKQFKIQAPSLENDLPVYLDDEGYIAHSLPYLAALARLRAYSDKHHFDLVKTESLIAPPESMGDENFTAGKINTVMGAVGVFNASATLTPELADSIGQYHFYSQEEYKKELLLHRK